MPAEVTEGATEQPPSTESPELLPARSSPAEANRKPAASHPETHDFPGRLRSREQAARLQTYPRRLRPELILGAHLIEELIG